MKNIKKVLAVLILSPILMATSCEDDECNYVESPIDETSNLILLTPLQTTYSKGDELTLKISIPSTNTYFGEEVNLFDITKNTSACLILRSDSLFQDNNLTFVKGSQGLHPNWFNLPFNSQTEMYELEFKVILNRIGQYSHYNGGEIDFKKQSPCPIYRINTDILWTEEGKNAIEFEVVQ